MSKFYFNVIDTVTIVTTDTVSKNYILPPRNYDFYVLGFSQGRRIRDTLFMPMDSIEVALNFAAKSPKDIILYLELQRNSVKTDSIGILFSSGIQNAVWRIVKRFTPAKYNVIARWEVNQKYVNIGIISFRIKFGRFLIALARDNLERIKDALNVYALSEMNIIQIH